MTPFRDGAAVAWYDTRDGNAEIYLRLIDAQGRPVGDEHSLTNDAEESYEVSIDALGDALAVSWYGRQSDGRLQAYVGVWDPAAGWRWREPVNGNRTNRNPVVRTRGSTIFCAWVESDDAAASGEFVRFAFWSTDGDRVGAPRTLGAAGQETWNLNAALSAPGEAAYVVFDSPDNSGTYELFLARVEGDGIELEQISASDGFASKYPDIALAAGDEALAALTWYDEKDGNQETYLAVSPVYGLGGLRLNEIGRRISTTDGPSIGSYVAWNAGTVGVAWSDQMTRSYDVFFQAFDSAAGPLGEPLAVTASKADSYVPAIVTWQDGFAIAWNEVQTGGGGTHDTAGSEVYFDRVAVDASP